MVFCHVVKVLGQRVLEGGRHCPWMLRVPYGNALWYICPKTKLYSGFFTWLYYPREKMTESNGYTSNLSTLEFNFLLIGYLSLQESSLQSL